MGPLAVLRARGAVLELHAHALGEMLIREFVKASLADSGHYIGDDLGGEFLIDEVEKAGEGMDVAQVQECGVFPPVPAFPTMIVGTLDVVKGTIEADSKRAQAMMEGFNRDSESDDEVDGIIVVDPERVQAKVVDMLEPVSVADNDGAGSDRDSEMREDLVDKEVKGTIEADSERVQAMVDDMLEPVSVVDNDGAGLAVRRSWEATVAANQLAHARVAAAAACRHAQWRLEHDVLEGVQKGEVGNGGPVAAKGCGRERCGGHPTALGHEGPRPKGNGGTVAAKGCGRERCGGHPTALRREGPNQKIGEEGKGGQDVDEGGCDFGEESIAARSRWADDLCASTSLAISGKSEVGFGVLGHDGADFGTKADLPAAAAGSDVEAVKAPLTGDERRLWNQAFEDAVKRGLFNSVPAMTDGMDDWCASALRTLSSLPRAAEAPIWQAMAKWEPQNKFTALAIICASRQQRESDNDGKHVHSGSSAACG